MSYIGIDIGCRSPLPSLPVNIITCSGTGPYTYFLNSNIEQWNRDYYISLGNGDVFNGNGYTINVNTINDNTSYGIFGTDNNALTAPIIRDLTINSIVINQSINGGSGGGGGFMQSGSNKFELHNCVHNGKITSSNSGGFFCQPDISTTNNIIIISCIQNGDIINNINGSGGFCGGGIANGCTRSNDFYYNFIDCTFNGNLYGDNSGGFCGASQNNNTIIGGGCIGNGINNNTIFGVNINISVNFLNCVSNGNLYGKNSGGICGGSDNYNIGGGCIGNGNSTNTIISANNITNIEINFTNCKSFGNLNNKNCGGICGGGDNINSGNNNIYGGGCIGNGSTSTYNYISVSFNNCIFIGDTTLSPDNNINYNNCGGICGGGDNILNINSNNYYNNYGAGCISNSSQSNILIVFNECKSEGILVNKNCGGICAGGDNFLNSTNNEANNNNIGAGCIGNGILSNNNINIEFRNCTFLGDLFNSNCGGICGGGDNIVSESNTNNNSFNLGSGCIGNNSINNFININFINCRSSGNYNTYAIPLNPPFPPINININENINIYNNCGGICAGGNNIDNIINDVIINNGSGCIGNNSNNNIIIEFIKCISNGNIYNNNSGGICGGGNNFCSGNGSGCIGNNSSSLNSNSININFTDCIFNGEIYGNNCAGICGGGDNYGNNEDINNNNYGGGCIANSSNELIININFNNCVSNSNLNNNNCGGMCGGGDNYGNGAGCIGNYNSNNDPNNPNKISINFNNCISNGNLNGNNCGGMCGAGDNYGNGGGCIGNYSNIFGENIDINNSNININFTNCVSNGNYYGTNSSGICSGGTNNSYNSNGGGCIGNYSNCIFIINFTDCRSIGNLYNSNNSGICGGGNNYGKGGGCIGNYYSGSQLTINFTNCTCTCSKINSENSGGICSGGNNTSIGGGCIGNGYNTDVDSISYYNIKFVDCIFIGDIISTNSGGICGGSDIGSGCIGNNNNNNIYINIDFINCKSISNLYGNNCGGICGGKMCIGNYSNNNTINVKFLCCEYKGNIIGNYSGGICGGGIGCIGYKSLSNSKINVLFEDCISKGNIENNINNEYSTSIGGICGGTEDGGCIGTESSGNINVAFNNINFEGNIGNINIINNCGGLCGGGDNGCIGNGYNNTDPLFSNSLIKIVVLNCKVKDNGNILKLGSSNTGGLFGGSSATKGGCIGNNLCNNIDVYIKDCITNVNLYGDNNGGLFGGSICNYVSSDILNPLNPLNVNVNITIKDCQTLGNMIGNNIGGLIGSPNSLFNNMNLRSNDIFKAFIDICNNTTNTQILNNYSGGMISGNMFTNNILSNLLNPLTDVEVKIYNCISNGNIDGIYSGGICGGNIGTESNNCDHKYTHDKDKLFKLKISSCQSLGHKIKGYNSGGILGGNVFSNNNLYVLIKNCRSVGSIHKYCSGILGSREDIYSKGNKVHINYTYSAGEKHDHKSYYIASKSSSHIYECYNRKEIYKLKSKNSLGNLPMNHWTYKYNNYLPVPERSI